MIPACERGHVDTVRFLLTTGIDVDHVNNLGWTCLLEAVILGDGGAAHQQIVTLLLDAPASVADRPRQGRRDRPGPRPPESPQPGRGGCAAQRPRGATA